MRKTAILLFFITTASAFAAPPTQWRSVGIGGGGAEEVNFPNALVADVYSVVAGHRVVGDGVGALNTERAYDKNLPFLGDFQRSKVAVNFKPLKCD